MYCSRYGGRIAVLFSGLFWAGTLSAAPAPAEDKVRFETYDKVEIQGTFYPTQNGRKSPTVILVHKLKSNSQDGGWTTLAKKLQAKDFAVLCFDFRGHGDSKNISDPKAFWQYPANRNGVRGYNPVRPKDSIDFKDFNLGYQTQLVNDLAAAKLYLDSRKHDAGDCNSMSTVIIGAEDGAGLAMAWLRTEWYRHKFIPGIGFGPGKLDPDPLGKDVVCAIWLSLHSSVVGGKQLPIMEWARYIGREKKTSMALLYGEQDQSSAQYATNMHNLLVKSSDKKDVFTVAKAIKGSKLQGEKLLNASLDTEELIVNYLQSFFKEKAKNDWERRDVKRNAYVWSRGLGQIIQAKMAEEELMNPIPLSTLGIP